MSTHKEVKIGSTVTVKRLSGEGAVKCRIMDMKIKQHLLEIRTQAKQRF